MSDLQALCEALTAVNGEILRTAQELNAKAQAYRTAAANAAAIARSAGADGNGSALIGTAAAFQMAARSCLQAAQALTGAAAEGRAFVQRTVGGGSQGLANASRAPSDLTLEPTAAVSLEDIRTWLPDVNPGYTGDSFDPRSNNCGNCALAVSEMLSGRATSRAGIGSLTTAEMEAATGKKQIALSPGEIRDALLAKGPGAHAVVGIDREGAYGHWFNAYNDGERVYAIDGQSGTIREWPPDYGYEGHPVIKWDAGI